MRKVVRAIITKHRFPNAFIYLYFQLHHEGDHLSSVRFMIMPLARAFTETNEIFLFSQELPLSRCHFGLIINFPFWGLNLPALKDEGARMKGDGNRNLKAVFVMARLVRHIPGYGR